MTGALRLLAALVLAMFAAAAWTTPGEAHAGHDAAQAAGPASGQAVSEATKTAKPGTADAASAAETDCGGHGAAGTTPCCGGVCHAVMTREPGGLMPLPIEAASTPAAPQPSARSGPILHVKRPPRPLAATVG